MGPLIPLISIPCSRFEARAWLELPEAAVTIVQNGKHEGNLWQMQEDEKRATGQWPHSPTRVITTSMSRYPGGEQQILIKMAVVLEAHNPAWLTEFSRVKAELQTILKDIPVVSIEHVGSTSIPGFVAKPVLDIDIENITPARGSLTNAGYQDLGEMDVPGRVAFRQPVESRQKEMRRNTYVVLEGCLSLRNHLDPKKILLEDHDLREQYGAVKNSLVESGIKDVDEYCRGRMILLLRF